ncbi:tetratricopeptide repeat-containing sulfotransferase family protein [Thalassotalea sediminis]|uniref:tetratricopeptide repeat-containing sulfotransferase family protein n=1 Tax=Thalassotalea sediminis TaxID=1759089 RepID=UPI0025722F6B|nr:sulfotransferase [Thalassotalea sediminis]
MNHQEIANQVLADIKNQNKVSALAHLSTLIDENAELGKLWGSLARLALSIGEIEIALTCADNYLADDKNDLSKCIQVASVYAETGRFEKALALLSPFTKKVDNISLHHILSTIYSQIGDKDNALYHSRKALMKNPLLGITWLNLAALKRFTPNDKELETLRAMEERITGKDVQNDIPYWYAFGKALLDIGESEAAFEKFAKGASLMQSQTNFNIASHKQMIDNIINVQTTDAFSALPDVLPTQGKGLIFIVGLPRSGTTLLQQLLTCHPEIDAGGESNNLAIAVAPVNRQLVNDLSTISDKTWQEIAKEYQQLMRQRFPSNNHIIDKSFNINQHLGLLSYLYPAATFIHINRKKAENAWSCFRTYFSQGITWSNSIAEIKEYFECDQKLLTHWKSFLSKRINEINYEDLITDPKATLTKVCNAIGIEYDEAFTNFHMNPHPVQTASVGQVRGPLTRASITMPEELLKHFNDFE